MFGQYVFFLTLVWNIAIGRGEQAIVSGNVMVKSTENNIPPNSVVEIKIEDNNLMDASSISKGRKKFQVKGSIKKFPIPYTVTYDKPENCENSSMALSISAVVNIGWTPEGDKWIRSRDYLTQTNVPFHCESNKDIEVELYV